MIAHAPVAPVVIPIYHTGMAELMPLNPYTRKIMNPMPRIGKTVTARAGKAIQFDDLLEEHERRYGPLRKLTPFSSSEEQQGGGKGDGRGGGNIPQVGNAATTASTAAADAAGAAGAATAAELPMGSEGDIIWRSTREERQLYSKIARRVEEALLELEAEARRDLGLKDPGLPKEALAILRLGKGEEEGRH